MEKNSVTKLLLVKSFTHCDLGRGNAFKFIPLFDEKSLQFGMIFVLLLYMTSVAM